MANESFFVDDHVRLTMQDIDQQVRRYLTACEREKASYRLVEEAIATQLIPQVENLMSKEASYLPGTSRPFLLQYFHRKLRICQRSFVS